MVNNLEEIMIPQSPTPDVLPATGVVAPLPAQPATPVTPPGFWQSIKAKLNPEVWMKKLDLSSQNLAQYAVYMAIGFVSGFLFKRFLGVLLIMIAICIGLLLGLEYLKVVIVDWPGIYSLMGLPPTTTLTSLLTSGMMWIKNHLAVSIIWFIGFIIGYKLG